MQQDPNSVSQNEKQQLDSAIGTRSTQEIMAGTQTSWVPKFQGISAQLWGNSGQVGVPIQAKLAIGEVGDKYEQEADRVAKDVVQQIHTPQTSALPKADSTPIQEKLQRKQLPEMVQCQEAISGGEASTALESAINSARGSGQPLDDSLQQSMGQAMGADFSGVRVHTDLQADQLNQSIQAKAFTTGQDVFFRQGEYQPGSLGGQELIAHELTHVKQQGDKSIDRCSRHLVQRMKDVGVHHDTFGDLVELDDNEPLPKNDDNYVYTLAPSSDDGKRRRWRGKRAKNKKIDLDEIEKSKKKSKIADLKKPKPDLFDEKSGGDKEGTFEYVANYLFAEVCKADSETAKQIWSEVWKVDDSQDEPKLVPAQQEIPDQAKKELLNHMIEKGLDISWEKLPIKDIMQLEVENEKPASSMDILEINPGIWDYLADVWYWRPWSQSKTLGVGFHTTDGNPSTVLKSKNEGGWGGITRPITAPFFQKRYALSESWNPLGGWLEDKGPAFRKGIKDNELLSTVSVATSLHACVKFPLANKNRKHIKENNRDQHESFKMTAYVYAVIVKDGYATFTKQDNPFPEIATGDIAIQDIIGYAKITRWHDYQKNGNNQQENTDNPNDSSFYYEVDDFVENRLELNDEELTIQKQLIKKAKEAIIKEQERANKGKYTSAEN
ncbi:DUF4157 domain-containing protein [Nostoc sp. FACHB-152]|uniref:eCIS core domain-containing protein n=1 Tax=unclassified Nostoc TaxID=2593658 RepID=UPI00168888D9|nr:MULTISPECIES: DUF4157 domain-containing protein [unclassified Nostoc]MBD2449063.1 DUF4157 domain-containing protein [Nostoc sp. FACHB-152]MBD2471033.1 DUF4157 domain-containing protein [Nostoc sp. FACHB-145]